MSQGPDKRTDTRVKHVGNQATRVKPLRDGSWHISIGFAAKHETTIIIPADAPSVLFASVEG